jgi:hypothetical protein
VRQDVENVGHIEGAGRLRRELPTDGSKIALLSRTALSAVWAGHVKRHDEEIEIALLRWLWSEAEV